MILKSRLSKLYSINNKDKTLHHEFGVEEMRGNVPMQGTEINMNDIKLI
jgi:hypothetical protein